MSADRKAKKRKQEARKRRQREREASVYDRVLPLIGAKELFDRLNEATRENILRLRYPDPEFCYGDDFAAAPERERVRRALKRAIDKLTLKIADDSEISARLYYRAVASMMALVDELKRTNRDPALRNLIAETEGPVRQAWNDLLWPYLRAHWVCMDKALAEFTRIDTAIYWYEPTHEQASSGKWFLRITLHKSPPQSREFIRDGIPRLAFRCGSSVGAEGIKWIEVPAALFGIDEPGTYPLFVQDHVIRRLHQRVTIQGGGVVHDMMWGSFLDPKVIRNAEGTYLIEYHYYDCKLGYFIVDALEQNVFLIRTFLFLTMDGTPEAAALWEQLRLNKPNIKELKLHKLSSFVWTDIQKDEELVGIFDQCGCGHLLRLARPETAAEWATGYARNVRLYLGMKIPVGWPAGPS